MVISSSRGSSQPRNWAWVSFISCVSCIVSCTTWEAPRLKYYRITLKWKGWNLKRLNVYIRTTKFLIFNYEKFLKVSFITFQWKKKSSMLCAPSSHSNSLLFKVRVCWTWPLSEDVIAEIPFGWEHKSLEESGWWITHLWHKYCWYVYQGIH